MKFIFKGHDYNLTKGEVLFHFGFKGEKNLDFTERIAFPPVSVKIPQALLKSLLDNLMLILGISYWKLYCPKEIIVKNNFLTREQAEFWNTVYTKGMGEFFYKNKIDFRGLINFPHQNEEIKGPTLFPRKNRSLVGIGGGKDSIVVAEMLKDQDREFDVIVDNQEIKIEVSRVIGKDPIIFRRQLDPRLFDLNKEKGSYNGHIPISAVYAFIGLTACAFYDYDTFVVGNEKSANYGNVEYLGEMVNHQWSKSEEFKRRFNNYLKTFVTPSISYFSPLQNMTELQVIAKFVKYPKYFKTFSSCNKNFRISKPSFAAPPAKPLAAHGKASAGKWCGECPKCLFVFICLAAFLPKREVINIFNKNLFEDKSLLPLFEELIGIRNFKPFECVGTPDEVKEALAKILDKGEFSETVLIKHYKSL